MDVMKLLYSKNRCLKKILDFSVGFLTQAETGDFSQINQFHTYRDSALKALSLYDNKISYEISRLSASERTPELIHQAKGIHQAEIELIRQILETDHLILNKIKYEQSRLSQELHNSEKNSQIFKKFKSTWVSESGETLDGKI